MIFTEETGRKIEKMGQKIISMFEYYDGVFIFGAGILGIPLGATLRHYKMFSGYIDNDTEKAGSYINDERVYSFKDFQMLPGNKYIIIACSSAHREEIEKQLTQIGLKEKENFSYIDEFLDHILPILAYYKYRELFVRLAQISLTERCTLKCRDCAHACYNVSFKNNDISLVEAKRSADIFFAHVDYINEFVLIGGEPFLYTEMGMLIDYISSVYRHKISNLSITTNGTVIPSENTLKAIQKNNVTVHISDYRHTIPQLERRYEELEKTFDEYRVRYHFIPTDDIWTDYGIGKIDRMLSDGELIKVFDNCKTPCREIRGEKFYYCVMARAVADNLSLGIGESDYLDLSNIAIEDKFSILAYQLGYSRKGYLDMCDHCYGADRFKHPVPAAIQLERR